jgi:ABC-2 type transport system permease protein
MTTVNNPSALSNAHAGQAPVARNGVPLPPASPPRTPVHHGRLFQRLRWYQLRSSWHGLASQPMRPLTILLCSLVIWAFVFSISLGGFRFLKHEVPLPLDGEIVGLLLDLLFLALGTLLLFSCSLILYGSLFASAETAFLFSTPVPDDQVFAYKFQGALAFSSWAFLLLGGPILIAYGLMCNGPWYFYLFLPLFFLGFVLLPGALAGVLALVVVNCVPRQRKQALVLGVVLVLAAALAWGYHLVWTARHQDWQHEQREAVNQLLGRFAFTRSPLMPTHWVSSGLRLAGRSDWAGALFYLAVVWSNGLLLYLAAAWTSTRLFRRGYNRTGTGSSIRRRYGGQWIDHALERVLILVRPSTRLLIVKDFRTFRRDPRQWGQVVLFCGLMLLYLVNMRRLFVSDIEWIYQNSISLLNLCAISLLLCTYTGRFVFPLLSLEGRKFWILGLLPVRREQLLWGKFAFAMTGGLVIAASLVLLSDLMLFMPWQAILLHGLTVTVLAAGLSGMSVGMGACLPNFRETDPSKIAVGLGGTLNLIAGLLFLILTVVLICGPYHAQMALSTPDEGLAPWMWAVVGGGVGLGLSLGVAAVIVPLQAGITALRRMEF